MRLYDEIEFSENSMVYKRARWGKLGKCPMCKPHRGCNRCFKKHRSWKKFRKNQYKTVNFF